jgi:superfamily II DNA or RNA helicase
MKSKSQHELFNFVDSEKKQRIKVEGPLYYINEKTSIGILTQLALNKALWSFEACKVNADVYTLSNDHTPTLQANVKKSRSNNKENVRILGCVKDVSGSNTSFFDTVNINGTGKEGKRLRPAQLGAVHALMSHWSLCKEVATIVLPTGTGKTETMLVTTLADQAKRTLVIVPTLDLKDQIAEKFSSWGMLRELGVIPKVSPNPTVLVLDKTLNGPDCVQLIERADIVISTPALIARADEEIQQNIKELFSHVYFDEAHHVKATEWDAIKTLFKDSKIVQFTATPYRNDRQPIEGKIVYNYPLSKALEDKCFSRISLVTVDERHPRKKEKAIADAAMERLLEDRKKGWTRHRMMVRAEDKSHAEQLYSKYQEWFPKERIVLIHSGTKGKKAIIENIKKGEYDIVVCVDMFKEGFDYPDFKIAAVHGVHKSLAVLLQFIGRFTRTQEGLGDASFVVNFAEEKLTLELENLFQEGSGWEEVISEIADAKKAEAESLLAFLQDCKPYSGFDSPDIELNPKLVIPALSCVCYKCTEIDWQSFKDAFNLNKYALSQPYINTQENVFYFTTQKRERVKWVKADKIKDQTWDLIVMYHDPENKLLYVGFSEKRLDVDFLVEKISHGKGILINGDNVFRSFDSIHRLSIVHAGIFKPANHLHRYSRLSGADVTIELSRWKKGQRCQKSDFVGVGFRDGFPVSVGASVKGKIWSPARSANLKEWKEWCVNMGRLITDGSINSNQLLEDSAEKKQLPSYPEGLVVLAVDWAENLYDRIHKITLEQKGKQSFMLSEASLKYISSEANQAVFKMELMDESITFHIILGGEKGHSVNGLDNCGIKVEGLKSSAMPLKQFFQENPPTMFLLNGCTIAGCIHTDYGDSPIQNIPEDCIETLKWENVDYTKESLYKNGKTRSNSIQEYIMNRQVTRGAKVVFNDDNAGEVADVVSIFVEDCLIRFEIIHCKYSKETSGARKADLYEVCGQAIISLRHKWKPEELIKHLARRNAIGVLKGKRFYHGAVEDLEEIKKAMKYSDVKFEFAIAQPGIEASKITADMRNFLGSVYSTIVEMTETKLRCYFNNV